jgi:sugar lactone lactonase YvrE
MMPGGTEGPVVLGINGVRGYGDALYFTNTLRSTFSRVPLDVRGAHVRAVGAVQLLVPGFAAGVPDDFTIDAKGFAWVARVFPSGLSVLRPVPGTGPWKETDLGWNTTFGGPSSVAFGRGNSVQQRTAYVVTETGQVLAVDTRGV